LNQNWFSLIFWKVKGSKFIIKKSRNYNKYFTQTISKSLIPPIFSFQYPVFQSHPSPANQPAIWSRKGQKGEKDIVNNLSIINNKLKLLSVSQCKSTVKHWAIFFCFFHFFLFYYFSFSMPLWFFFFAFFCVFFF